MAICYNHNDPIYQHMFDSLNSKRAVYDIINANGREIPSSIEEANTFIDQYKVRQEHLENLKNKDVVGEMVQTIREKASEIIKKDEKYTKVSDNSSVNRVSDLLEQIKNSQGRRFYGKNNDFYAKKGTVIHKYMEEINNELLNGNKVHYSRIVKKVKDTLKEHPEFKDDPSEFFNLKKAQFDQLVKGSNYLKQGIEALQNDIDKSGKYTAFTEVQLFDSDRNLAGTVDLLVVFSDGSVALYDYKSRSFGKQNRVSTNQKSDWIFQISNYSNMLKNVYGVSKIRHARIIPIDVSYQTRDTVTGEYINQAVNGFQSLAIYNNTFTENYLKAIPFGERSDDKSLNTLLKSLENKRHELNIKRQKASVSGEKIKLGRQLDAIDSSLQNLYLEKDISVIIGKIKDSANYYKKFLHLDESEGGLSLAELNEAHEEIGVYSNLVTSFRYELSKLKGVDSKKFNKVDAAVKNVNSLATNLQQQIEAKIYESFNNETLYSSGQGIGKAAKQWNGLDSINIPAFNEAHKWYTFFKNKAYNETDQMLSSLESKFDNIVKWGKSNGYSNTNKLLSLFYDSDINLVDEYSPAFWKEYDRIRKKQKDHTSNKKGDPLTAQEKKFMEDNFEVDQKAWKLFEKNMKEGLQRQVDQGHMTAKDMKKSLELSYKYTNPNVKENFYKGQTKEGYSPFVVPKKNRRQYYSEKYQFIQQHPALKEYHQEIRKIIDHYTSIFGANKIGRNFLPNVHKDVSDIIKDGSIFNISENFETYTNKFKYREADPLLGSYDSKTGTSVKSIPLMFTDDFTVGLSDKAKHEIEQEVANKYEKGSDKFNEEVKRLTKLKEKEKTVRLKSTNIQRSLSLFISAANENINMHSAKEIFDSLRIILSSDNFQTKLLDPTDKIVYDKMIGEIAVTLGANSELVTLFDNFYNRLIFKKSYEKELAKIGEYSSNKILQSLNAYASANFVGLHVTLMASNYITARNNFRIISKEGRLFDDKNHKNALKAFGKKDEKFKMLHNFFHASNRDLLAERADERAGVISKYTRLKTLFLGHVWGDDRVDALITYAMSDNWVLDSDGTIKNPKVHTIINKDAKKISDLIKEDKDGKTYVEGLSFDSYNDFRNVIRKAANEVKGMADETQRGAIYASMAGAQLMFLRSWMPGMAQARFKSLQYDMTYRMIDEGRYIVAMQEVFSTGIIPSLKNLSKLVADSIIFGKYRAGERGQNLNMSIIEEKRKRLINAMTPEEKSYILRKYGEDFSIDKFIELHESKMNAFANELRTYMVWAALLTFAMMQDWEDRADDDNAFKAITYNTHEVLRRALLELTFWTSPTSAMQIVRSPFALMGVVDNSIKVAEEFLVESSYLLRGQRDPNRRTFPGYRLMKATPVVNRIDAIYQIFEPYQRPKSTIEKIFWDSDEFFR